MITPGDVGIDGATALKETLDMVSITRRTKHAVKGVCYGQLGILLFSRIVYALRLQIRQASIKKGGLLLTACACAKLFDIFPVKFPINFTRKNS